jgi:phosphatidylglycerol:prolipoprotein diacylglycerol transferase
MGGFLACVWFVQKRKLPLLALGDVIVPGVILGMAIGRVGCLLNGCCYGGLCDGGWCIQFPRLSSVEQRVMSPPYRHQLTTGRLHGFVMSEGKLHQPRVQSVDPNGPAERAGLIAGVRISAINGTPTPDIEAAQEVLALSGPDLSIDLADGQRLKWTIGTLPSHSLPVHPSQIYGAISGFLIFLVLLSSEPFLQRRGAVVAMLLTCYPPVRFLEELIRDDEPGQLGTSLTISQWVSVVAFLAAIVTWVIVFRGNRHAASSDPRAVAA